MPPSSAPDPHLLGDFVVSGDVTLGAISQIYAIATDTEHAHLTLADYFDVHLDRAPEEGATLELDSIVLVARSISGGRVSVVGLRLPEEEEETAPLSRMAAFRRALSELWMSLAGYR
jgi:cell volume regulation protein A